MPKFIQKNLKLYVQLDNMFELFQNIDEQSLNIMNLFKLLKNSKLKEKRRIYI
jgi:hypothetical protein